MKVRVFTIPNGLKQALLRPAHDWCMEVLKLIPMDGTLDLQFFSYAFYSATDRFPLNVQSRKLSFI